MHSPPQSTPTDGNLNLTWAVHLLHELWRRGVRRAILSPGSRSTPLVLAAAIHPGYTTRVVLDERSAAFQALGEAKMTGRPTLLVCTSGSALANYLPAVVEAEQAGIPLLMLTADRPPHLRGTGNSQTLDQLHFFGNRPLLFHELGEPRDDSASLYRLRQLAEQAVSRAIHPGGVVHLNLPFRKPLEPAADHLDAVKRLLHEKVESNKGEPDVPVRRWDEQPTTPFPPHLLEAIRRSRRPLLLAGTDGARRHPGEWVRQLQEWTRIPVMAEPGAPLSSSVRTLERFEPLLHRMRTKGPAPDLILRTGHTTYSKAVQQFEQWLDDRPEIPVWHLHTRDEWQHGSARIDHRIVCPSPVSMDRREGAESPSAARQREWHAWSKTWEEENRACNDRAREALEHAPAFTDPVAIRRVCDSIREEDRLLVSNSMTIRDLARVRPADCPLEPILTQRGASGIDGLLSTAIGMARTSPGPVTLLIGDLAALHDSGALLSLAGTDLQLRIVVLENGGGTIFRMLPIAGLDPEIFQTCFETPQATRISALARAHNLPVFTARRSDELRDHLARPITGPELLECITDPDASMDLRKTLQL